MLKINKNNKNLKNKSKSNNDKFIIKYNDYYNDLIKFMENPETTNFIDKYLSIPIQRDTIMMFIDMYRLGQKQGLSSDDIIAGIHTSMTSKDMRRTIINLSQAEPNKTFEEKIMKYINKAN